jgi:hypothetical protein
MHNKLKRGEISPDEFNRMTMSISNQWADFSNLAKNYNTAVAGVIDGLDSGELSNASQWALEQFGDMANLKDKRLQWMPSQDGYTNLYVTSVDDEGNMVGDPTSVTSLTNPGNLMFKKVDLMFKKVDLPGATAEFTKTIAAFQRGRTTDPRLNPEYNNAKEKALVAVTANDDDVLSILVDYGDKDGNKYTLYKEGDEVPEYGIKMVLDENQNWVPEINKTLEDKARESVDAVFESQVGSRITPAPIDTSDQEEAAKKQKELQAFQYDMQIAQEALIGNEKSITDIKNAYNRTPNVDKIRNIAVVGDQTTIQFESGEERVLSNAEGDRVASAESMMTYLRPKSNPSDIRSKIQEIEAMEGGVIPTVEGDVTERGKSTEITITEYNDAINFITDINDEAITDLINSFGEGATIERKRFSTCFNVKIGKEDISLCKKMTESEKGLNQINTNISRIKELLVKGNKKKLPGT